MTASITSGPLDEDEDAGSLDEVATLEGATLDGATLDAGALEETATLEELTAAEDFGGFLSLLSLPPQPTSSVDRTNTDETCLIISNSLLRR